jgi:hypothetical protein
MTETLSCAHVKIAAAIGVDVTDPLSRKHIDSGCPVGPSHVEIFPERRGPKLDHSAPIMAYEIQTAPDVTSLGSGTEDERSQIGREPVHRFAAENVPICFLRVA